MTKSGKIRNSLNEYLEKRDRLYSEERSLGNIAHVVAHNSVTNRKNTATPFVNQIHSITELLEAGFGLDLDFHMNGNGDIEVCHSPFDGCAYPLLDQKSLKEVTREIRDFFAANPQRAALITVEGQGIKIENLSERAKEDLKDFFDLSLEQIGPERFKQYIKDLLKQRYSNSDIQEDLKNTFLDGGLRVGHLKQFGGESVEWIKRRKGNSGEWSDDDGPWEKIKYDKYGGYKIYSSDRGLSGDEIINDLVDRSYQVLGGLSEEMKSLDAFSSFHSLVHNFIRIAENRFDNKQIEIVDLFTATRFFDKIIIELDEAAKMPLLGRPTIALEDRNLLKFFHDQYQKKVEAKEIFGQICGLETSIKISRVIDDQYQAKGIEMAEKSSVDDELCKYFKEYPSDKGIPKSYETSLFYPFGNSYSEEVIDQLLNCGVRNFKFDYAAANEAELDPRMLQVDRFNFQKICDNQYDSNERKERCFELLEMNQNLANKEPYSIPVNSAFITPFVGKPLSELNTLCSAISCFGLLEAANHQRMIAGANEKYEDYDFALTALSVAGLVATNEIAKIIGKKTDNKILASGISAAVGAAGLYLHSQSIIPFGASLISGFFLEKAKFSQESVTALQYGIGALVRYGLDPEASLFDVVANVFGATIGGFAAAKAVKAIEANSLVDTHNKSPKVR